MRLAPHSPHIPEVAESPSDANASAGDRDSTLTVWGFVRETPLRPLGACSADTGWVAAVVEEEHLEGGDEGVFQAAGDG